MNFFKSSSSSKTKAPPDLVRALRDNVAKLDSASTGPEQRKKARPGSSFLCSRAL